MGGAKSIIAKQVACHVTNHSPDSRKENMLSLRTGLRKGGCEAKQVACHVTNHSPDSRKENMLSLRTGLRKGGCTLPKTHHVVYCCHCNL